MTLIRWNNHPAFADIFNDLFEKENESINRKNCGCMPSTNIMEEDNRFLLEMALPGYSKKDVKISVDGNLMEVSSEKEAKKESEANYTRREFSFGSFKRSFTLPKTVDFDNIKADFKNGILEISLPKKKEEIRLSKEIAIS